MKKLAIILALMLVQAQVLAVEATNNTNVEKKPAQQQATQQQAQQQAQQKTPSQVQKDEEYLLKYNIRDLEAAPWLHGGKRSYN